MARLRAIDAERRRDSNLGPDFSEALARGLGVVTAFNNERRQMTLSDVARAVDLPKATVRRALYTLAALGYVESDGRLFRLTPRVLTLASAYLTSNAASAVIQPACERISAQTTEASSAAVLDEQSVVMIAHASPPRFVAGSPGIGFRVPAFASSLGRVLLAALPDPALAAFLDRLAPERLTEHTLTDKRKLREAIEKVRKQGYSLVDQEVEVGFRSLSVPLRRYDGATIAALNIGSRIERVPLAAMRTLHLPLLLRAADELRPQLL
jgi:IclR family pca regulon transcriptional regulator